MSYMEQAHITTKQQVTSSATCLISSKSSIPPDSFDGDVDDVGISLTDLWHVIWPRRLLIVGIALSAGVLAAIYSFSLPNIYKAQVLMATVGGEKGNGGLSGALGNLGGLASIAGISLPGGGSVEESLAVLKSREFLVKFVNERELMPVLFASDWDPVNKKWKGTNSAPGEWDAYRLLTRDVLSVSLDKKTSLVSLSIEWTDPELAAHWGNDLVALLNRHLRNEAIVKSQNNLKYLNQVLTDTRIEEMRQTLFALISEELKNAMLANAQDEYAFRVIDPAIPPDIHTKPYRMKKIILAMFAGTIVSLALAFFLHWSKNNKLSNA